MVLPMLRPLFDVVRVLLVPLLASMVSLPVHHFFVRRIRIPVPIVFEEVVAHRAESGVGLPLTKLYLRVRLLLLLRVLLLLLGTAMMQLWYGLHVRHRFLYEMGVGHGWSN